jgi:hypothetical protein
VSRLDKTGPEPSQSTALGDPRVQVDGRFEVSSEEARAHGASRQKLASCFVFLTDKQFR